MKKIALPTRKHGYKARAAMIERLIVSTELESAPAAKTLPRLKTLVTFQSESQAYLWTTQRVQRG